MIIMSFENFDVYQITHIILVAFIAIMTFIHILIDSSKKDEKEVIKVVPTPFSDKVKKVKRLPMFNVGCEVKIKNSVFTEHLLGHCDLESSKDKTFKIIDIFDSEDREIKYKIRRDVPVAVGCWETYMFVVPEYYLRWACDDSILLYFDCDTGFIRG